jgi:phage protein U
MYGQLGNIRFDGLVGWDSFVRRMESNYAEHARIEGKPRLQKIGDGLDRVSFEVQFHAAFCNPSAELAALRSAKIAGEVLPLIDGQGFLYGDFVIQSIEEVQNKTFDDGSVLLSRVKLELLEYIVPVESSATGFAANADKVVQTRLAQDARSNLLRTSVETTAAVTTAGTHITNTSKGILGAFAKAKSALRKAQDGLDKTAQLLDDVKEAQNQNVRIKNDINRTKQAAQNAVEALEDGDINGAIEANRQMQEGVFAMNGGLSEVATITGTRQ